MLLCIRVKSEIVNFCINSYLQYSYRKENFCNRCRLNVLQGSATCCLMMCFEQEGFCLHY